MTLICTKRKLDYIYLKKEDDKLTKVDENYLLSQERKLANFRKMGFWHDKRTTGVYGYYFNPRSCTLKKATWEYSEEYDPRGYIETIFTDVDITDCIDIAFNKDIASELESVLIDINRMHEENPILMLKVDINSLFDKNTDEKIIKLFILFFYMFVPKETANKLVFMNDFTNKAYSFASQIATNSEDAVSISSLNLSILNLLRECSDMTAYKIVLKIALKSIFGDILQDNIIMNHDGDIVKRFEVLIRAYNDVLSKYVSLSEELKEQINEEFNSLLDNEINALKCERPLNVQLEKYVKIIKKVNLYSDNLQNLIQKMNFTSIYTLPTEDMEMYIKKVFLISRAIGNLISEVDRREYSEKCLSYILNFKSGEAIKNFIETVVGVSVEEFFAFLTPTDYKKENLYNLYEEISHNALDNLSNYKGYCNNNDDDFKEINDEIQAVIEISDVLGYNFREKIFRRFGAVYDIMQRQNFSHMFFYHDIYDILSVTSGWKAEDFYTQINLSIFISMKNIFSEEMKNDNKYERLSNLLDKYIVFRKQFDKCVAENDAEKFEAFLDDQLYILTDLIKSIEEVYYHNIGIVREIFKFICMNITGNPTIALCMMYAYHQEYINKGYILYKDFDLFFEMMFKPIYDCLTLEDCSYIINMMNNISKEKNSDILQKILRKNSETGKKRFTDNLVSRLCKRYNIDSSKKYITTEIEWFKTVHVNLINNSSLDSYTKKYVEFLKKSFKSYINRI
ncbi:MAG: hypothetical protein K2K89_13835 [Ruminococcus sp.]|nr:hypothetical protein [Ruminococcus sp.]